MKLPPRLRVRGLSSRPSIKDRILNNMRAQGIHVEFENDMYELHRTHAGRWQRARGAWLWFIRAKTITAGRPALEFVGSCSPASKCAVRNASIYPNRHMPGAWEIDPPGDVRAKC